MKFPGLKGQIWLNPRPPRPHAQQLLSPIYSGALETGKGKGRLPPPLVEEVSPRREQDLNTCTAWAHNPRGNLSGGEGESQAHLQASSEAQYWEVIGIEFSSTWMEVRDGTGSARREAVGLGQERG